MWEYLTEAVFGPEDPGSEALQVPYCHVDPNLPDLLLQRYGLTLDAKLLSTNRGGKDVELVEGMTSQLLHITEFSIEQFLAHWHPGLPQYWGIAVYESLVRQGQIQNSGMGTSSSPEFNSTQTQKLSSTSSPVHDGSLLAPRDDCEFARFVDSIDWLLTRCQSDADCFRWVRSSFDVRSFFELMYLLSTCDNMEDLHNVMTKSSQASRPSTDSQLGPSQSSPSHIISTYVDYQFLDTFLQDETKSSATPWVALFRPFFAAIACGSKVLTMNSFDARGVFSPVVNSKSKDKLRSPICSKLLSPRNSKLSSNDTKVYKLSDEMARLLALREEAASSKSTAGSEDISVDPAKLFASSLYGSLAFFRAHFLMQSSIFSDEELWQLRTVLLSMLPASQPFLLYSTTRDGLSFTKCGSRLSLYGSQPVLMLVKLKAETSEVSKAQASSSSCPQQSGQISNGVCNAFVDPEIVTRTRICGGVAFNGFAEKNGQYVEEGVGSFLFGIENLARTRKSSANTRIHSSTSTSSKYSSKFQVRHSHSGYLNYSYLNYRNPYHPNGLGFGGQSGNLSRLWVDTDFHGHMTYSDRTFEHGHVFDNVGNEVDDTSSSSPPFQWEFDRVSVEVYGLGGNDAMNAYEDAGRSSEQAREAHRKVDRARFAESSFDREHLLTNTFQGCSEAKAAVEEHRREKK